MREHDSLKILRKTWNIIFRSVKNTTDYKSYPFLKLNSKKKKKLSKDTSNKLSLYFMKKKNIYTLVHLKNENVVSEINNNSVLIF